MKLIKNIDFIIEKLNDLDNNFKNYHDEYNGLKKDVKQGQKDLDNSIKDIKTELLSLKTESKKYDDLNNKLISTQTELNNKLDLLQTELNNVKSLNELLFNNIQIEKKYTNFEMLTLDSNVTKKRVLLAGFYGAPNLGDELMLEVLVSKLKKLDNIDLTVMLSENRDYDITKYPNFKIIHYPKSILDINILANYFDTVIFGGGALLDDHDYNYYNNQLTLSNSLINICYRMIQFNKQTILYGLSTSNTFSNEEYLVKLDYIFKNCTYISLRDTNSLEVLQKYNIDVSKVKIVDDLVFSCNYKDFEHKNTHELCIGVNYICTEDSYNLIKSNLEKIIEYLNKNKIKYKILLLPFYEYCNNDTSYYKKLIIELNDNNITIANSMYSFKNVCDVLKNVDVAISMRYHGTLLFNLFGIPNINILYDIHRHYNNKIKYLYDNYKFEKNQVLFSNLNDDNFINIFNKVINEKRIKVNKEYYDNSNKNLYEILNIIKAEKND